MQLSRKSDEAKKEESSEDFFEMRRGETRTRMSVLCDAVVGSCRLLKPLPSYGDNAELRELAAMITR